VYVLKYTYRLKKIHIKEIDYKMDLQVSNTSRKNLCSTIDNFFKYWINDTKTQSYRRPETFTEILFGEYKNVPMVVKIMKKTKYDNIAKQKLNRKIIQYGSISDYEKEIKMLYVLEYMFKKNCIPFALPFYFSQFCRFDDIKSQINVNMDAAKNDSFAVICTRRMDYTFNKYINMHIKSGDSTKFLSNVKNVLFVVLFNVYTLFSSLGFVHCDLHISNILLSECKPKIVNFLIHNQLYSLTCEHQVYFYDMFYSTYNNKLLGPQGSTFKPKLNNLSQHDSYKADIGLFCATLYKYIQKCHVSHKELEDFLLYIIGGAENIQYTQKHIKLQNYNKIKNINHIYTHKFFKSFRVDCINNSLVYKVHGKLTNTKKNINQKHK
jgi:hypothetical protein